MKSKILILLTCFTLLGFAQKVEFKGQLILDVPEDYKSVANKTKIFIEIDKKVDSTVVNDSLKFSFKNLKFGKAKISFKPNSIPGRIYLVEIDKNIIGKTAELTYSLTCKYNKSINKKTCPTCKKGDKVLPIAYGLIMEGRFTGEGNKEKKKKKYKAGGCVTTNCDPNWYCERDDIKF